MRGVLQYILGHMVRGFRSKGVLFLFAATVGVLLGAQPGQHVTFEAPDGREVTLVVPAGVVPGQTLQVKIPAR